MRHQTILFSVMSLGLLAVPARALGHCDGLDGPVVASARQALRAGDPREALVWVSKKDEAEIRQAFDRTLSVRKLGGPARDLADTYFFETLVRVHRAGEGAPYTGLKPAGRDLGPAIPAADRALETGNVDPVVELLTETARRGLRERFAHAAAAKKHRARDLEAGRRYVAAYVDFVHYVERLFEAGTGPSEGHYAEAHGH